jgi:hypothetical protein
MRIGENAVILEDPPGILLGLPPAGGDVVIQRTAEIWKAAGDYHGKGALSRIVPDNGNAPLVLASSRMRTGGGIFTGRLVSEKSFIFSPAAKSVLLLIFFLTSFLTIFLLFNMRADPVTIIRTRLRGIRAAILEECRIRKNSALPLRGWELEQRREDVHRDIKKALKMKAVDGHENSTVSEDGGVFPYLERKAGIKLEEAIDAYIDSVWDEIEAVAEYMAMPCNAAVTGHSGQRPPSSGSTFTTGGGLTRPSNTSAGPHTARSGVSRRTDPAGKKTTGVAAMQNRAAETYPARGQTAVPSRPFVLAPELSGTPEAPVAFADPAKSPVRNPGENPAGGQPVFKNRNGITYINRAYTSPDKETVKKLELDENFRELVNSVIDKDKH